MTKPKEESGPGAGSRGRAESAALEAAPLSDGEPGWEKIVIHLRSEIIKGLVQTLSGDSLEAVLSDAERSTPHRLSVRRIGSEAIEQIPIDQAKAVFFVRSFEGDSQHRDLRFYSGAAIMQALWVRIEFTDGEVIEGLVDNTVRYLMDEGFFLRPTDPRSNNRLIYVQKRWIKDCRVLGLREM